MSETAPPQTALPETAVPAGPASAVDGRTRHYGQFYGLTEAPVPADGRRIVVVYGNCQAEALRVLLAGSATADLFTVRIPPVFELTRTDLPHLEALLARVDVLLTQPIRDDYRDLPLGTAQVTTRLRAGAEVLRWPVVFDVGSLPFQAVVRDPDDPTREPPVVPYHDLRTLAGVATGSDRWHTEIEPAAFRAVAAASRSELARRESAGCDLGVSDLLEQPAAGDFNTVNHPGNRILIELARRVQATLGQPVDATDPGRVLLGEVITPGDPQVLAALGVEGSAVAEAAATSPTADDPADDWQVQGRPVSQRIVRERQERFYREHPGLVAAGMEREHDRLVTLGLR